MAFQDLGIHGQAAPRKRGKARRDAAVMTWDAGADTPHRIKAVEVDKQSSSQSSDDHPPLYDVPPDTSITINRDEPGREDFDNLGQLLVYLRKTYFDRQSGGDNDRPRTELKAAAVVEFLQSHKYSMTSGSYSQLEQGKTLPRTPEQFLSIISKCLHIDRSSKYWILLRSQYVYDHTARYVGKEFADQTIVHGSRLLASMHE